MTDITLLHGKKTLFLYCNVLTRETSGREILCARFLAFKSSWFMRQITENVLGKQEIDCLTSNIQKKKASLIGSFRDFDCFIISLEICTLNRF